MARLSKSSLSNMFLRVGRRGGVGRGERVGARTTDWSLCVRWL